MEGFTLLVEQLGTEEAYAAMDQVYELLSHKVHDYTDVQRKWSFRDLEVICRMGMPL